MTEDLVKKRSALFINSISHNTGYFITVQVTLSLTCLSLLPFSFSAASSSICWLYWPTSISQTSSWREDFSSKAS